VAGTRHDNQVTVDQVPVRSLCVGKWEDAILLTVYEQNWDDAGFIGAHMCGDKVDSSPQLGVHLLM
jgi:hypothetical protein